MSNIFIWLLDRTLSDATNLSQCGPGNDDYEGVIQILKAPALLEPHHQFV